MAFFHLAFFRTNFQIKIQYSKLITWRPKITNLFMFIYLSIYLFRAPMLAHSPDVYLRVLKFKWFFCSINTLVLLNTFFFYIDAFISLPGSALLSASGAKKEGRQKKWKMFFMKHIKTLIDMTLNTIEWMIEKKLTNKTNWDTTNNNNYLALSLVMEALLRKKGMKIKNFIELLLLFEVK